jgi:ABC-type transport system involved in multi-copper enzyme maturation permease subunit
MTKTFALFLDSYRELNAKRLFWIVLLLSALVVGAFSLIGVRNGAITVLWFDTPFSGPALQMLKPAMLYKLMFSYFGIGFWLTWLANILALISTAGIFPDFMAGGSIDLYLSKPISRFYLFLTKYIGGLLFVTLQVTIFAVCSFFLIGFRGHQWEPAIFLSIPLVVLVFSYLFSFCVLLGVLTRSTIAALLLTLLFWFAIWGVQTAESWLLIGTISNEVHAQSLDRQIESAKAELAGFPTTGPAVSTQPAPRHSVLGFFAPPHQDTKEEVENRLSDLQTRRAAIGTGMKTSHGFALAALTPLPKTGATVQLLDRELIKRADLPHTDSDDENAAPPDIGDDDEGPGRRNPSNRREFRKRMEEEEHSRSATWIIGTSIGFEVVVLGLAGWLFCRRDY